MHIWIARLDQIENCNVAPHITSSELRGVTALKLYTECPSKYMDCVNLYRMSTILSIRFKFVGIWIGLKGIEMSAIS